MKKSYSFPLVRCPICGIEVKKNRLSRHIAEHPEKVSKVEEEPEIEHDENQVDLLDLLEG